MSRHDTLVLQCTDEQMHDLASVIETKRAVIRIDRKALANLICDHSKMVHRLWQCGVDAKGPEQVKPAPKLVRRQLTSKGK